MTTSPLALTESKTNDSNFSFKYFFLFQLYLYNWNHSLYAIFILILCFSHVLKCHWQILSFLSFVNFQKGKKNIFRLLLSPTVGDRLTIFFSVFTIMLLQNALIQRPFLTLIVGVTHCHSCDNNIKVWCWANSCGLQFFSIYKTKD